MLKIISKQNKKLKYFINLKRNVSNIQILNSIFKSDLFDDSIKNENISFKKLEDLKSSNLKIDNLEAHCNNIASDQTKEYIDLIKKFNIDETLLEVPKNFEFSVGWTRYSLIIDLI